MSTKNILTGVVAALALVLVLVVILVKTGVFDGADKTTTEPEIEETKIVVVTGTDVNGNTFEYTMMSKYKAPKVSSNYIYPTRKKTTTTTTEPESTTAPLFIEETSAVQVTDPNGEPVTDENGVAITEIVTYTVPVTESTTAEPTTAYSPRTSHVVVTNKLGIVQKDQKKPKSHMVVLAIMLAVFLAAGFLLCGKYGFALIGGLVGYGLALLRAYKSLDGMNGDISGYALTIGELCAVAVYALI